MIVNHLIVVGEWGFPFSSLDLRLLVKSYLDRSSRRIKRFKENLPGLEWARSFLKRHKKEIRPHISQNIKTKRAEMNKEDFEPENIMNYDETNLSDDPGQEKLIFKRGKKYPERVMNYAKGSTSIMFCVAASLCRIQSNSYVEHLDSWSGGGPKGACFNRSKSGWFDALSFDDWFRSIVLPWARQKEGRKVIIGDNLYSHFSLDVISLCEEHNISFVCLVPNSTHLSQPLDVAFYGPLKRKWRNILKLWKVKNPCLTSLPKDSFPMLLKELVGSLNTDNLISGFRACGIYPFNPKEVITKLPQSEGATSASVSNISSAVLEQLKRMRCPDVNKKTERRKWVSVEPGKSVCVGDLCEDQKGESEDSESEDSESEVSESEDSLAESDKSRNDEGPNDSTLNPLTSSEITVGQWVKVIYEEEVFVGKVLRKAGGETMVQCLEKPFGIREPQNLEREQDAVFYEHIYESDVTPQLKKAGRGWKYSY